MDSSEIRERLVELLVGQTDAGARVSASRAKPQWREAVPAIVVYTPREEFEQRTAAPLVFDMTSTIAVEFIVEENAGGPADDVLDTLKRQVLAVVFADRSLGLHEVKLRPLTFETGFAQKGARRAGGGRLTFEASWLLDAPEGDPGATGKFLALHVEHDLAPPDGAIEAVDDQALEG